MEREVNHLPATPLTTTTDQNLVRPIIRDSSSTPNLHPSSGSISPPHFLRHVQAAFKRHRPLGTIQSNIIRPRRTLVPQRATSKESTLDMDAHFDPKKSQDEVSLSQRLRDCISQPKSTVSGIGETQEIASTVPSSECASTINTQEGSYRPFDAHKDQLRSFTDSKDRVASSEQGPGNVPLVEGQKKVHFEAGNNSRTQDMEWDTSNQGGVTVARSHDLKHQSIQSMEVDGGLRSGGGVSSSIVRTIGLSNQEQHFTNFLQSDLSQPMTQSLVVGSSCPTTTLMNSTFVPMFSSTTYCSQPQLTSSSHSGVESLVEIDKSSCPRACGDVLQFSNLASKYISGVPTDQGDPAVQTSRSHAGMQLDVFKVDDSKVPQNNASNECDNRKDPSPDDYCAKGNITDKQSQATLSKEPSLDVKVDSSKLEKQEKGASCKAASNSRKKNYDPDLFFKVNGKLYQRLGKIGSGGSSEVHKVISSDCKIYALKKIKLKGRDYATAYGFYQEIEYLNKLKGKNNIIQLVDCEVTDKTLLQEFNRGSMSNKDGRVKEDGHIYMVLEYGEIDLAQMLSQKWKELDSTNAIATIDENWLRFFWQQILLAVNTIHEERIVHSDLKPANFLLVRGSLKLIDFGIAKAIMSDTTNIQRDSQVGTLSYMSPEAFMCNETDANGNTIKCGRPSDIWSLGCILYQMVYGRTPFAEYKTFWAKFKVITDPNHEIIYEPVSNPWLLDIMKKCLAWDRNERWRIPQLLQHPFLVPPVPPQISHPQEQSLQSIQFIATSCENDQKALTLCSQLQDLLSAPMTSVQSPASSSRDQLCELLGKMSNICIQLQEKLATSGRDATM